MNHELYPLYRGHVETLQREGDAAYKRLFQESTAALEPNTEVLAILIALMDFHLKRPLLTPAEFAENLTILTKGKHQPIW